MRYLSFHFLLVMGLLLAACNSISPPASILKTVAAPIVSAPSQSAVPPLAATLQSPSLSAAQSLKLPELNDRQGAVTVTVKPLDLLGAQERLIFEISLNTHSVDLSMDLAASSTLATDNGSTIQAVLWDAPPGGHHVTGRLVFPASVDGKMILAGASRLLLIIKDVDVPVRIFEWALR